MNRAERDLFALHAWFALLAVLVLWVPMDLATGVRIAALVVFYNLAFPVMGAARGHAEWWRMWSFALPLSVLMVVPDWFLSAHLGVLRFPPDGLADIGTVTAYMAGLWTIPFVLIIGLSRMVEQRQGRGPAYLAALVVGGVVIVGAESFAHRIPMWEPVGVETIGNVALYIVPAELLLSVIVYVAYTRVRDSNLLARIGIGVLVMIFYVGAATTSWFLLEGAGTAIAAGRL